MTRQEILAAAKPILFNTDMVRAILDGRKTVTRRVVKRKYNNTDLVMFTNKYGTRLIERQNDAPAPVEIIGEDGIKRTRHSLVACMECKLAYKVGDLLYVREKFNDTETTTVLFAADKEFIDFGCKKVDGYLFMEDEIKWRPSIHMPKEAARIFLRVTDVRCERLQEITEGQAEKEGFTVTVDEAGWGTYARMNFAELWDTTIKPADLEFYGWNANPWVWVYEFERIEPK